MVTTGDESVYFYWARIDSVYDGDTATADFHLGFGISYEKQKLRLYGINAPELRGGTEEEKAAGKAARDRLKDLVLNKWVKVETIKDEKGKYGRYLAILWLPENQDEPYGTYTNINNLLIEEGHAVVAMY